MTKQGKIIAIDGSKATVEVYEESVCDSCSKNVRSDACDACPHKRDTAPARFIARNGIGACVGDIVEYSKSGISNVLLSVIAFIIPFVCYAVVNIVLSRLKADAGLQARLSLIVLIIMMIAAALYSYFQSKARCDYLVVAVINKD
ncbi:MAG: SoxR reducing system RseC family protein [Eubacteriales bacterium]